MISQRVQFSVADGILPMTPTSGLLVTNCSTPVLLPRWMPGRQWSSVQCEVQTAWLSMPTAGAVWTRCQPPAEAASRGKLVPCCAGNERRELPIECAMARATSAALEGVVWCDRAFLTEETSLAAAFSTDWSRFSWQAGRPARVALS